MRPNTQLIGQGNAKVNSMRYLDKKEHEAMNEALKESTTIVAKGRMSDSTALLRPKAPHCPVCGEQDICKLAVGESDVYQCSYCDEIYFADNNKGRIVIDAFTGP